jgi:hypothetical protein
MNVSTARPIHTLRHSLQKRLTTYFAEWKQPQPFDWKAVLLILVGTLALFPLTSRLPNLGYEWFYFDAGRWTPNYPPWMPVVLQPLLMWDWRTGLALLTGVLYMTVAVSAWREAMPYGRQARLGAALLALLSAPVLMLTWLGNASPIVLLGVVALPFGVPLATVQPHLGPWALLARRRSTLFGLGFLLLTLLIWGFWPERYLGAEYYQHEIALGWFNLGLPVLLVGLVMLCFTNADPLRLMAVGAFITPYLMAVHLVVLLPSIGRVRGWRQWLLWGSAWLPLLPVMFFDELWAKYPAMIFPLLVWWLLRPDQQALASTNSDIVTISE